MHSATHPFALQLCRWLAAAALAIVTVPAALAMPAFSTLYVLGDSLSDTGNTQAVLGTNALVANLAGYGANGRFSNGPVWHEPLATSLGLPPATRSRSGGNNYSHGGARLDRATGQSAGLLFQYDSYFAGPGAGGADSAALYAVWAGGNDMRDLVSSSSPQAGVQTALSSLNVVLTGLLDAGARTLLVPSLPDLGRIPENRTTPNAASASFVSGLWNDGLFSVLSGLAGQYSSASIYYLNVFGIFNSVLDNPASFGFTNTTGQCRSVTNFGFTETSCANPDTWVFWDAIHPTRAAHAVLGAAAFDLLSTGAPLPVPEAATVLQLALGLMLLAAFAARRARRAKASTASRTAPHEA